tara:strand:- start:1689 stop:2345 length:657 start_codon:yes stop_codon:yes gene_type:complete
MGNKLKNKKLIHKLTWYTLERDDIKEDLEKYDLEFQKEFAKELQFLQHKKTQEESIEGERIDLQQELEKKDKRITEEMKELHKLFRNIAKKTHPDLHGDEFIEIFKAANEAFDNRQWIDLITIAADLNIELPEFSDASISLIEQSIEDIENSLSDWTNSLCWVWASRKKELKSEEMNDPNATTRHRRIKKELNDELKKNIRQLLNIDEEEFKKFLNQS